MNKKSTRALASATVVGLVLTTAISTGNVQAAPGKVDRLHGANRYETAAKVATSNWKAGESENVILVSGEGYADALSASLLAQKLNAPVLLTGKDSLDVNAKNAIKELGAKHVYILGSKGVVSGNIQSSLEKEGKKVTRLAGKDRYETNIAIANELVNNKGVDASEVLVVNGNKYLADALTAAPVAAKEGKILLLVGEDEGSANEAKKFIDAHGSKVTVIGRDVTVSDAIYNKLGATKRVKGGSDRFETNRLVLDAFKMKGSHVYVANGQNDHLVDSLVASALAGKFKSPVVLVSNDKDADAKAVEYMKENLKISDKTDLNVVGSEAILSDDLVKDIDNAVVPEVSKEELVKKANEAIKAIPAEINKDNLEAARSAVAKAETAVKAAKDAKVDVKELKGLDKIEAANKKIAEIDKSIAEAKKALKVQSVSAINPWEIQVQFNQPVDRESAINIGNYDFKLPEDKEKIEVTDNIHNFDDKTNTVTFRLEKPLSNGDSYGVDVKDGVLSKDLSKKIKKYRDNVKVFNDTEAPSLVKVEINEEGKLKLTFNKPVKDATVTVDGEKVNLGKTAKKVKDYSVESDKELKSTMLEKGDHKVAVYNAEDVIGNKIIMQSASYVIGKDNKEPAVKAITQATIEDRNAFNELNELLNKGEVDKDRLIKITFSEPVTISKDDLTINKGNHQFDNSLVILHAFDKDGKKIEESNNKFEKVKTLFANIGKSVDEIERNYTNSVYEKDEDSAILSVNIKGFKNSSNLIGEEFNGEVSLQKDLNAPKVISQYRNELDSKDSKLTIVFDRMLDEKKVAEDKITVIDKNGTPCAIKEVKIVENDKVEIALNGDKFEQPYTVKFDKGAVKAKGEYNKKENEKQSTIVSNNETTNVTKKLKDDAVNIKDNKITINFDKEMDDSALDISNYLLDGKPIEGNITTDSDKKIIMIKLKDGFTSKDISKVLTISENVKTENGTIIVGEDGNKFTKVIEIKDTVKPTIKDDCKYLINKEKDIKSNKIKITFSEEVKNVNEDDFKLVANGADIKITEVKSYPGDNKSYILQSAEKLNVNQAITLKVVTKNVDIKDLNDNDLVQKDIVIKANNIEKDPEFIADTVEKEKQAKLDEIAIEKVDALSSVNLKTEKEIQEAIKSAKDAVAKATKSKQNELNKKIEEVEKKIAQQ